MVAQPPNAPVPSDVRASDVDREETVGHLRDHFVAGRMTLDELSHRIAQAYAAQTRGELQLLVRDLPDATAAPSLNAAAVSPATPVPQSRLITATRAAAQHAVRASIAVLGSVSRRGRWRVDSSSVAGAFMGSCTLDLRQAELSEPEVSITAIAIMGSIDVIVPPGVDVDMAGIPLLGSAEARIEDSSITAGSPVIHVRAFSFMGSVTARTKPSLLQSTRDSLQRLL